MVVWLCENHLLMSNAAQRLDLNNPDDIHMFAQEVGDQHHLEMLFLISVADTVSTNPKLWTGWRAEQMRNLFRNTQDAFRRGLGNPKHKEDVIAEVQRDAMTELQKQGLSEEQVLAIWGTPGDDYFLREGTENIVWQKALASGSLVEESVWRVSELWRIGEEPVEWAPSPSRGS